MRISLTAGRLLVGLGLMLCLGAAASGLAEAQRESADFAPLEEAVQLSQAIDPWRVPAAGLGAPRGAPALPTPASGPAEAAQSVVPLDGAAAPARRRHPMARSGPAAAATAAPVWIPDRIVIPVIELDAPVVGATLTELATWGQVYQQWEAPNAFASGWHTTSATLGVAGNTVLNGHHNIRGEVFGRLEALEVGDLIWVHAGAPAFVYRIVLITILPERWQPIDVRLANAEWMQPSRDERLTLVTCWPPTSNTHRLVIVATPLQPELIVE